MRRQPSDLIAVALLAVVCAVTSLAAVNLPVVRAVAALPLALILPGYALMAACFPERMVQGGAPLLLSLGLSLTITVLLGLGLYWAGIRLETMSWALGLTAITLIASGTAWRRRQTTAEEPSLSGQGLNLGGRDLMLLGLAVVVSGAAIGLARLPSPPNDVSGYTALWLNPTDQTQATYQLGVTSYEFADVTYHLQVTLDGAVTWEWPEIKLSPGETWNNSIALPTDRPQLATIEAVVYRLDNPSVVYRRIQVQRSE